MLFSNTHMRFNVPYEFHVASDEGLNVSGITGYAMVGLPFVGRNERIGWTVTVNYPDVVDVYRLAFDHPDDPLAYRYDGGYRRAEEWAEPIRVRTDAGVEERPTTFRRSHHGPVFEVAPGEHYAIRRANQDGGSLFPLYYAIAKARNLDEFQAAFELGRLVYHNFVYADVDGNIFYLYGGAHPRKDPRFDWERPLDGSDPATAWQGTLTVAETPQIVNPASGWLQNANATPFHASAPGDNPDPAAFPPYLVREAGPRTLRPLIDADGNGARARRSRQLLAAASGITFDRWTALATDNHFLTADEELPGLFDEWERLAAADPAPRQRARRAAAPAAGMGPARRGAFRGDDALRPLARGDARRGDRRRPGRRLAANRRARGRRRRPDRAPRHVADELGRHQPPPAPALPRRTVVRRTARRACRCRPPTPTSSDRS